MLSTERWVAWQFVGLNSIKFLHHIQRQRTAVILLNIDCALSKAGDEGFKLPESVLFSCLQNVEEFRKVIPSSDFAIN
jgi:hypothetical protein